MPRRKKVDTTPKVRIDIEGMQGFFEVQRYPAEDDYWSIAYRVYYNTSENHKGYKRHKTVTVNKRSNERQTMIHIRYGLQTLYQRIFGYRYYYHFQMYGTHRTDI